MEIKGEDFIKKVQLKQEKSEIEQRLNEIKNSESGMDKQSQQRTPKSQLDKEVELQEEREYSDIMLGRDSSNEQNKKRYLILGLALVILFLLTIIIIRLLTNDSTSEDSFTNSEEQTQQELTGNENIEEQYQKIINEKLKNIKEEKEKETQIDQGIDQNLDLEQIEQKEVNDVVANKTKPDVFEVKKEEVEAPKPVVKKTVPKQVVKKSVPKTTTSSSKVVTSKPRGTYIQIGAFSKMPSNKYLSSITSKGFSYKIYKVSINGKIFHKMLIGPYTSRGQAKNAIDDLKRRLNISGAFILTY